MTRLNSSRQSVIKILFALARPLISQNKRLRAAELKHARVMLSSAEDSVAICKTI